MLVAGWVVVAWLVAGCGLIADATPGPERPCGEVFGTQRCLAMTDATAAEVGRTRDDVTAITLVGDPLREDGTFTGGARPITVRVTFHDGTAHDTTMCGGVPSGPECTDAPRIGARPAFSASGGYMDVPCPVPVPRGGCGTPLPSLQPAAVDAARALSVAKLAIPIDHVGAYEVPLGEATLPNGVGTVGSFAFVDDWPADVSLRDGVASLEIRSLEPDGRPFENYYDHGWRAGVEHVEAVLVFDVLWFKPGATLAVRDIKVR